LNLNLAIGHLFHHDGVAEVAGPALDLDALLEELLEGVDIEDLVASRLRGVDDEL
jgi:transcriptional/translational regulatory protein YebC/TACO1